MRTASLHHHITSDAAPTPEAMPAVNTGATLLAWTDRYAATVVRVTPRRIEVRQDNVKRVDSNGRSESQKWQCTPNPEGMLTVFTRRKDGKFYERGAKIGKGYKLVLGTRDHYSDPSF